MRSYIVLFRTFPLVASWDGCMLAESLGGALLSRLLRGQ